MVGIKQSRAAEGICSKVTATVQGKFQYADSYLAVGESESRTIVSIVSAPRLGSIQADIPAKIDLRSIDH